MMVARGDRTADARLTGRDNPINLQFEHASLEMQGMAGYLDRPRLTARL